MSLVPFVSPKCLAYVVTRREVFFLPNFSFLSQMSQRDADGEVQQLIRDAEANVRILLDVPDNYSVLMMHGAPPTCVCSCLLILLPHYFFLRNPHHQQPCPKSYS